MKMGQFPQNNIQLSEVAAARMSAAKLTGPKIKNTRLRMSSN